MDIFKEIYRKENGYGAGSSHAITGYKVRDNLFITLHHENYYPHIITIHNSEETMMEPAERYCEINEHGEVFCDGIEDVETITDYFQLVYIARCGEVVRDDS